MAQFDVTELDFQKIKDSIKDHFRSQSKYNDWDFNGSGLSILLDILAYNTHYNAMVAHFSMNEAFLDSAQIRGNVVSHAKLLGYTPRSALAARASINIVVTAGTSPTDFATLARGTRFRTTLNGTPYTFVILDPQQAPLTGGTTYNFTNVELCQGTLKRMIYRVDNAIQSQKFVIPEENVDTTTMRVRVKANEQSNDYTVYTKFSTLSGVTENSTVYFLQENASGKYEIYFGDGILGKKPVSNNIVEIEYVYTDGAIINGASKFDPVELLVAGSISTIVTTVEVSYGAADRESIESIRYNAPFTYTAQNRAVTADDYRAIIEREIGNIDAISVWGGEDAAVPDYGKVFISIKPVGTDYLTASEKNNIINNILRTKNVVSITPVLVDPEYTSISLDVFFKYNSNLTDRSKVELQALVLDTISNYNDTFLKRFDGVFRYSQFLKAIDVADPSILNSDARVFMYKEVVPSTTISNYFDLQYSSPIYKSTGSESIITTSAFTIDGIDHYFGDSPITGSNNRTVYMYKVVNNTTIRVMDVGLIYPTEGRVVIGGFIPDTATPIRITVLPDSNDLAPKRNQLLEIDLTSVTITGDIDTIAVAGAAGAVGYTTPSRHR